MFETTDEPRGTGTSIFLFLIQLFIAPPLILIISLPLGIKMASILSRISVLDDVLGGPVIYGFIASAGVLSGRILVARFPQLYLTGTRVWILPLTAYVAIGIASAVNSSPASTIKTLLIPHRGPDEGLPVILLTFPTLAICCYSAGMFTKMRYAHTVRQHVQ